MSTSDAALMGVVFGIVGLLGLAGLIKTVVTIYETNWRVKEIEKDVAKLLRERQP